MNYPIYIPEEHPDIAALLVKRDPRNLAAELKRRASLGSASAAALWGYLEFMGAFGVEPNLQAAIACCTEPAKAGDPYAQYVLSWAYWATGNRTEAMRWMKLPAAASFLPALVDSGRMLVVMADNEGEIRTAVGIMWGAHRLGHVVPLAVICGIAFRGQLGLMRRLLAVVLFPYAAIRLILVLRCEPFGIRSFSIDRHPNVPFFKPVRATSHSEGKPE